MQRRIVFTIFTAAAVALALGFRTHSSEAAASAEFSTLSAADSTIAASFNLTVGPRVSFELKVTNNTDKRVEISFPNGQTHDFVVLDSLGREVWKWSAGKMFTQVMRNKMLESHQSISFVESWKNPDTTGTFTAVARLSSRNFPLEQRAPLVLDAGRYRR